MKKWQPVMVYAVYFALLSVLRWRWGFTLSLLWLGGALGFMLEWVDRLVDVFWTNPQTQLSLYVQHLVEHRQFWKAIETLRLRRQEQQHLVSQSVLFLFGWIALATYVLTSTGSVVAMGMVLGAGLKLLYLIALDWGRPEVLKQWLFWQIKRPINDRELKTVVGLFAVVFSLLSIALM